ncbi:MAG: DUF4091 domain-containing protein, partial [Oscillospiraceae bacterium]|nr:DUF4091 domain-containing protein [Oscillospiraceae bacterium]
MQKNLTKVLSLVLALVMVLGLLPISALASEAQVASSDLPTAIEGLSIAYPYNTETVQLTGTVPNRFSALTFESARNEVESAQMILTPSFKVDSFELTMNHLFNEKGNIIPASAFEVYTQHYVTVSGSGNSPDFGDFETLDSWFLNKKYIEDVFHPREGNKAWDGVYPDALIPQAEAIEAGENTIVSGNNQGIWVNLNVGDAAPGTYTGSATLTVNGTAMQIPVSIRIYDVTLPEEVHMTTSMGIWWDQLEAGEGDMSKKLGDLYYDYLVSKRIAPWNSYGDWYETQPLVESIVEKAADPAISSYLLYYYADGKVVNRESLVTTLSALINKNLELANAGNNIDLFEKAYFYFTCVDEPAGGSKAPSYAEVQVCIDIFDDVKTELAPMLDAYPELKASFLGIKNMVTGPNPNDDTFYMDGCADYSDHEPLTSIYNSVMYTPQFHHMQTQEQRDMYANDEEVWWYGCCHPVAPYPTFHYNCPLVNNRAISWMMYDYGFDGMLYSCTNYWGRYTDNGISLFDYWNGYGSGTPGDQILVYPGSDYGIEGPIGSMRLETIRESSEDYEYMWMLENQYGISDLSAYTDGLYDGAIVTGVYDGQTVDPDGDGNTDAADLHHTRRVAMLSKLETLNVAANGATEIEPGTENFVRGQAFEAGVGLNVDFEDAGYASVTFEYKLTSEGQMVIVLRSPGHVPYYGTFYFDANGERYDYAGIYTEKLADGYILVTCDVAALNVTNNNDNRDNAPEILAFLDVYSWTTANGYIDNVQVSMDAPVIPEIPEETEPETTVPETTEPEVTEPEFRGERFEAGVGLGSRYLSNVNGGTIAPIGTLSFDYKLDDEAIGTTKKMTLILRRASSGNWTNSYVEYTFIHDGVRYEPANVTTQILEDGYVHVEIDMTALEYDDYGVFDVYDWTNVGGYLDNISVTLKPFASIYANGEKLGEYTTLAEAVAAYETGSIVLEDDVTEDIVINSDLYLDLNGKTLTGNISGEGMLYGMDSANDTYDASACGRINGTVSCALATNCKNADNAHRYVAIADDNGYTFHRFYAGITKQSLAPATTGVGYKAEFYADETVLALVESVGYDLWLEGGKAISRTRAYQNEVTLRVNNYDIANYGETNLYACASITINGEKIVSSEYSLTMRQVVETVNAQWELYTKEQKIATQDMVKANENAMTGWDIATILNWSSIVYRGQAFEAGVGFTKYLSNVNGEEITPAGIVSFDYKLDAEADGNKDKTFGLILRRASSGNWTKDYVNYTFRDTGTR